MSKKFVVDWFYSPLETRKETRASGFLGLAQKEVDVTESRVVNLEHFSEQLEGLYNRFDEKGYDVVNVLPVSIGSSEPNHSRMENGKTNYLGDIGFSITRGTVVIGKKRDNK